MKSSRLAWYSLVRFDISKMDTRAPCGKCWKIRCTLFEVTGHTLEDIGTVEGFEHHLIGPGDSRVVGSCRVAPQLPFDGRHRLRGAMRGEVVGVLDGRIGHVRPGDHVVEQADPEGLVRIDHPA